AKTPKTKPSDPAFFSGHPDAAAFRAMEDAELKAAQAALDKMLAVKGKRTIENTLVPYNEVQMHGENAAYGSSLLEAVHPDSTFRADAEAQTQRATKFLDDLSLNRAVYDAIVQVDVSKADPATRYFHEKTLRDFRLSGVDKDEATRAKISTLLEDLTKTGQDFDRNIRQDSRTIQVDGPAALAGLPDDFIKSHPASEANGKITLSIEYPDLGPVMRYAKSEDTRRRLMHEAQNRAYPANMAVLDSLIVKRDRLAHVLGYPTWADYITQDKMIENAANAQTFIDRLKDTTFKRAHEEYAVYLKRKQEDDPKATQLNRWEASYYGRLIRMRDYDYDPGQARQYFPFDRVKQGVLDVTATMFGLTYKQVQNAAVWDPSVECYEVYEGKKMLGRFFLDLHPRPGKYNHAAKFTIRQGVRGYQVPEHALVCNFAGGKPGDPGLMEHSDVETFFHEFGHLIHAILGGQGQWEPVAGTATQRDFVEAPSQMLEEWTWDAKVLQTFAKNEKGEPIPAELVQKMRKADAFGRALGISTQAFYSAVSLSIYNRPPSQVNTDAIVTTLEPQFSPIPTMPDTHMQTAFGHLDGYSAYYYTYMWSLVIAKDMFSRFNHDNLLDPTVAKRYRDMVLAPGGSKPAKALVHEFLERDYDFKAFDEWLAGKG
ncbi:MAG TPA: M3 family metallopeptidase, partial [Candidatus Eisenbacteria bacterium]|nr:M3 family metallopeptidase [Candidatus Eisenbacteria bacterium]